MIPELPCEALCSPQTRLAPSPLWGEVKPATCVVPHLGAAIAMTSNGAAA
jgi:hypothetical protein